MPDDRTIVVERVLDELGDWRVCVLTPFGGKIHAPWSMAATAKIRNELAIDVETMWSDDGFIVRFPETDAAPRVELVVPEPDEVEQLVIRQLGSSSLFAAKFRESAARALLLPRRRAQGPDAAVAAAQARLRPAAGRVALRIVSDDPRGLSRGAARRVRRPGARADAEEDSAAIDSRRHRRHAKPSPFAGSLLFKYTANFIYDGDAPLAERRAQALAIDQSQLRELLGEAELRELLDADSLAEIELQLQHLDERRKARSADAIHDLLLRIGDLTGDEIAARYNGTPAASAEILDLVKTRRIIEVPVAGEKRFIAVEDASRYRDALGTPLPAGLAERYLEPVADPVGDLVLRFARTHGPFTPIDVTRRLGLGAAVVMQTLERFVERGRLIEGEFRPDGTQREWCDADVLRSIRRRSLAKLRKEVEPVDQPVLARLFTSWQSVTKKRRGLEALLDVIETLQGYPMAASIFESEILSARIEDYKSSDLDALSAAARSSGPAWNRSAAKDGRIAVYLTDHLPILRGGQATCLRCPSLETDEGACPPPENPRLPARHTARRSSRRSTRRWADSGTMSSTRCGIWSGRV